MEKGEENVGRCLLVWSRLLACLYEQRSRVQADLESRMVEPVL